MPSHAGRCATWVCVASLARPGVPQIAASMVDRHRRLRDQKWPRPALLSNPSEAGQLDRSVDRDELCMPELQPSVENKQFPGYYICLF